MQLDFDIQQPDHPSAEDIEYVSQQFRTYNDQQSGVFPSKELHLFAHDQNGQIVGGLAGSIFWGWLHVDTLWAAEPYRNHGLGTALMDQAEAEAIAMGVHQAFLESTDFQAVGFYEKRGYQIFAQLENQPPGHICYYMKKIM
jgi:ribosomal protein S18 acetylase RimI-like enzyme